MLLRRYLFAFYCTQGGRCYDAAHSSGRAVANTDRYAWFGYQPFHANFLANQYTTSNRNPAANGRTTNSNPAANSAADGSSAHVYIASSNRDSQLHSKPDCHRNSNGNSHTDLDGNGNN